MQSRTEILKERLEKLLDEINSEPNCGKIALHQQPRGHMGLVKLEGGPPGKLWIKLLASGEYDVSLSTRSLEQKLGNQFEKRFGRNKGYKHKNEYEPF